MRYGVILIGLGLALTLLAGIVHYAFGDTAGTFASAPPLILVAPMVAFGTDGLRGRMSTSALGIVQSAFGNVAELAITIVALAQNLPDVVRIAIAGSLFGNAILLGGLAGLLPFVQARGRTQAPLRFDAQLFSGIATLCTISTMPIALLSFYSGGALTTEHQRNVVSLVAGIVLLTIGCFFVYSEVTGGGRGRGERSPIPLALSLTALTVGAASAALTSEWFVTGFEPAMERIGIPTAFAALVIIPLVGNVAENYVALRFAWSGDGDGAMSIIMHSVIQIALIMTGLLLVLSRFIGAQPLTLHYDPVIALALVLSMVVLWMVVQDGEMEPREAIGLLGAYVILGATVWAEGSF